MALIQVALNRRDRDGLYAEILDICEKLSPTHGSATNALANMVWESPAYKAAGGNRPNGKAESKAADTEI